MFQRFLYKMLNITYCYFYVLDLNKNYLIFNERNKILCKSIKIEKTLIFLMIQKPKMYWIKMILIIFDLRHALC